MSRTDKDVPLWVAAEWWEPVHYQCPDARSGWAGMRHSRSCDLPPAPVVRHPAGRRSPRICRWVPMWPRIRNYRSTPPRLFVDLVEKSPTRARVRDDCRRAIAEYRATGQVDVIPPIDQHRHCAAWLYW